MADGKVVIEASLDTKGIDKGVREIKNTLQGGAVNKTMRQLAETTEEFAKASKEAGIGAKEATSNLDTALKAVKPSVTAFVASFAFSKIKDGIKEVYNEAKVLERSLNAASTLFNGVKVNSKNLENSIKSLSAQTGFLASELGDGLYQALSAGIPATENMEEAMKFLEASTKLAKAGFADFDSTVRLSASILNAYSLDVSELERVQDVLMQTQNKGITTVAELSNSLAMVTPIAAAAGVSIEQVGAAIATSTASGTQTSVAITNLKSLISELSKSSQQGAKNLEEAAKAAGLSATSFTTLTKEGKSLSDIILLMQNYAKSNGLALNDMFGSIEASTIALQLAKENGDVYSNTLDSMENSAGLVSEAFNKVTTNSEKFEITMNNLKTTIGSAVLPIIDSLKGSIAGILNSMLGLVDLGNSSSDSIKALTDASANYNAVLKNNQSTDIDRARALIDYKQAIERTANSLTTLDESEKKLNKDLKKYLKEESDSIKIFLGVVQEAHKEVQVTTLADVEELYSGGRLSPALEDVYTDFVNAFEQRQLKIEATINQLNTLSDNKSAFLEVLNDAVAQGVVTVSELEMHYEGLGAILDKYQKEQQKIIQGYKDEQALAERLGDSYNPEERLNYLQERLKRVEAGTTSYYAYANAIKFVNEKLEEQKEQYGEVIEESISNEKEIKAITDARKKAIEEIEVKENVLGDAYDLNKAKANAYLSELNALIELGLDAESEAVNNAANNYFKYKNAKDSVKDSSEPEISWPRKILDDLDKSVKTSENLGKALGSSFDVVGNQIGLYESAIKKLIQEGLMPGDIRVKELTKTLDELYKTQEGNNRTADIIEVYHKLEKAVKDADNEFKLFGDTSKANKDKADAYRSAILELANSYGYSENDLTHLIAKLKEFEGAVDSNSKKVKTLKDIMEETFSANAIAGMFGESITSLFDNVLNIDEEIAKLEKTLSDEQTKIDDRNKEIAKNELELKDALARGNEKDIENIKTKISELNKQNEASKELIKTTRADSEEIKNGSKAWREFAKAGLLAIADVLEGFALKLAALAVEKALMFDFGGSALAGAGSVAAYTGVALVKGYAGKYERGGIVPNVGGASLSGDNLIARVNPGELILNRAQQSNLAAQLESGSVINISLSGGYFYGLDSQEVAVAIYSQIENAIKEGIL